MRVLEFVIVTFVLAVVVGLAIWAQFRVDGYLARQRPEPEATPVKRPYKMKPSRKAD